MEAKRRAPVKSGASLHRSNKVHPGVPEKGGFIVSAMYEEIRLEDLSPEEKLRGEPQTEIEVPGAQKPESLEVKMEFNPNTE